MEGLNTRTTTEEDKNILKSCNFFLTRSSLLTNKYT